MPMQGPYNIDWIYSTGSDAHVANHRDWFINYTPFTSRTNAPDGSSLEVVGVGDVQLEVNMKSAKEGASYHPLILRDVLHAPAALTNVVAAPILEDFSTCSFGRGGEVTNPETGVTLLLDKPKLFKLWLVGQPRGQTSLDPNGHYWINVGWPESERTRWEAHKREAGAKLSGDGHKRTGSVAQNAGASANGSAQEPTSTKSKKNKKKKSKAQTAAQEQDQTEQPAVGNNIPEDQAVPAVEPITQQLDQTNLNGDAATTTDAKPSRYSAEEKAWLKANYGNEFNFLRTQGWKIYKEKDRKKGEEVVRSMMAGGEGATLDGQQSNGLQGRSWDEEVQEGAPV